MSISRGSSSPRAASPRINYLDGLRASLMLLGIPFHAALAFSGDAWLIESSVPDPALDAFADFLHVWRMPAFFVVAGFFAALMLHRHGPSKWLKGRFKRIGIPLLAGMVILSPIQWVIVGWGREGSWEGAAEFVASSLWPPSYWWTLHLWFLVELLLYCLILAAVAATPARAVAGRWMRALSAWVRSRPLIGGMLVLIAAAIMVVVGLAAWQTIGAEGLFFGLLSRNAIIFAPAFALGVLLGVSPQNVEAFMRVPVFIAAAIGAVVVVTVILIEVDSTATLVIEAAAWVIGGLAISALAFRLAARVFGKPRAAVRWLVDGSLVIYLVHQPLVLLFGLLSMSLGLYSVWGWLVTVTATALVSVALYELINLSPLGRFLGTGTSRTGLSIADVLRAPSGAAPR